MRSGKVSGEWKPGEAVCVGGGGGGEVVFKTSTLET
jgi:hypothetical protein